ncbi:MAG: hypothetical protein AAGI36_08135, partial [Pseudomonadota bacterium]
LSVPNSFAPERAEAFADQLAETITNAATSMMISLGLRDAKVALPLDMSEFKRFRKSENLNKWMYIGVLRERICAARGTTQEPDPQSVGSTQPCRHKRFGIDPACVRP